LQQSFATIVVMQAQLPEYQPIENYRSEDEEQDRDLEDPRWRPNVFLDNDLLMYITAARSIAAFQGKQSSNS